MFYTHYGGSSSNCAYEMTGKNIIGLGDGGTVI